MSAPLHGYCSACLGPIPKGQFWTLTKDMHRVHHSQDDCVNHQLMIANRKRSPKQLIPSKSGGYRIVYIQRGCYWSGAKRA